MKKVMLVAVMSLGTMAAFAQEDVQEVTTPVTVEAVAPESDQATEAIAEEATEAVMASEEAVEATEIVADAAVAQDGFIEVTIEEVPVAITEALSKDYPEAKVSKALKNDKEQYKLEVIAQDGTELVLFADSEGNWIEM
ncbi:MAG: hypothetical protein MUO53_12185 [Maribacter sp.]|nr:hypothetical protein [Maribacter sp.]